MSNGLFITIASYENSLAVRKIYPFVFVFKFMND